MAVQYNSNNNLRVSLWVSLILFLLLSGFLLVYGKRESFLIINGWNGPLADVFFKYYTHAGDGIMWVPFGLFCLLYKRKYLIAVILGILVSTLLTHLLKRVVFPDELRPLSYLSESFPVHEVEGVKRNYRLSFPSGHTATAFTIAILLVALCRKKHWAFILPLLALLAAYSRVYLGQHYVTDLIAGMAIGIVSGLFSLWIYRKWEGRKL